MKKMEVKFIIIVLLFLMGCENRAQSFVYKSVSEDDHYVKKTLTFEEGRCDYRIENYIILSGDTLTNEGDGKFIYSGSYVITNNEYVLKIQLVESSFPISFSENFILKFKILDSYILSEQGEEFEKSSN